MKNRVVIAVPAGLMLLLSACEDTGGGRYGISTGDGPMRPGIYEAIQPDGARTRMVLHKNGDYAEMTDNKPKPTDAGKWRRDGNQLCMASEMRKMEVCFREEAQGAEGGFTITLGEAVGTFRPIALSP